MSSFSLPHNSAFGCSVPEKAKRAAKPRADAGELVISITPSGLRVINAALHERQAHANAALERAIAPQLRELRRAVERLGSGQ